jgi:hypothetical protein
MQVIAFTTVHPTLIPLASISQEPTESKFAGASTAEGGSLIVDKGADHSDALSIAGLRRVIEELCRALSSSLEDERESAEASLQRANTILGFGPPHAISTGALGASVKIPIERIRGGLAPWRIRRVKIHIETNLA